MEYIKSDVFLQIAHECNFDAKAIIAKIQADINPAYTASTTSVNNRISNYRRKGLLPLDSGNYVSLGEVLKGTSTLFDSDGSIKQQWVKTDVPRQQQLDAFKQAIETFSSSVPSATPSKPLTAPIVDDTMAIYPIGDAHVGMLAWKPESGADNDLVTIETALTSAITMLVQQATPSKEAFIIDVGDWFHSDNQNNRTSKGNNALDVDGRYAKVLEVGLLLATKLIDCALTKHETVHWRSAIGNHNDHSALMMNQFIKAYYRNDSRVIVHCSPAMFYYHKFGKNLIGITHGHAAKAEKLGEIMAVDCNDYWSETRFRYWYTGHVHHQSVKEFPSCVVETFRTLSGKDAWHASMGYRSGQDMKCIILHKDYGEVSRTTVNLAQLPIL